MAPGTPEGWLCANHPWHGYAPAAPLRCRYCGEARSAAEALVSLVAGWEGWSETTARGLVAAHAAEVKAQ